MRVRTLEEQRRQNDKRNVNRKTTFSFVRNFRNRATAEFFLRLNVKHHLAVNLFLEDILITLSD